MARYDVYQFNGGHVMDVQNNLIEIPGSRVVVPLLKADAVPKLTKGLHPKISLNGEEHMMATHLLAATPQAALKPVFPSIQMDADDVTRALDLLFQGY